MIYQLTRKALAVAVVLAAGSSSLNERTIAQSICGAADRNRVGVEVAPTLAKKLHRKAEHPVKSGRVLPNKTVKANEAGARSTVTVRPRLSIVPNFDTNGDGVLSLEEVKAAYTYQQALMRSRMEYLNLLPKVAPGAPNPSDEPAIGSRPGANLSDLKAGQAATATPQQKDN
jgi:hypothetical protein